MRTVFILGAGASQPYGLPSGYELVNEILGVLRSRTENFENWGFLVKEIEEFIKAIEESKPMAIDDLLARRADDFLRIGKLAIAHALVQFEKKEELTKRGQDDDWYSYFFEHLRKLARPVQHEEYSFITFNYDRSLEYYLDMATNAHYGESEPQRKKAILDIPILHVHGHLGMLPSRGGDSPYEPAQHRSRIMGMSKNLKLTDDEADSDILAHVQTLIQRADRIRFLGFGYHETNLKKLDFQKNAASCNVISGTAYGKSEIEILEIKQRIPVLLNNVELYPMKILNFFREAEPIDSQNKVFR